MALYGGIDSGKEGYASVIDGDTGKVIECNPQPLLSKEKGDQFDLYGMNEIATRWKALGVKLVVVELQTPQGGARSSAQRGFMQAAPYFLWRAFMTAHEIRVQLVTASVWKRIVGVMSPKRDAKKAEPVLQDRGSMSLAGYKVVKEKFNEEHKAWNRENNRRLTSNKKKVKGESNKTAQQFFPGVDLRRTPRCTTLDDNKCESLLMAVAASRVDTGATVEKATKKKTKKKATKKKVKV